MTVTIPEIQSGVIAPGGNLLDVARVIDVDNMWFSPGEDMFMSFNVGGVRYLTDWCAVHPAKTFDAPAVADARTFAVYKGIECRPVGLDLSDAEQRAREAFERFEPAGVAEAFAALTQPTEVVVGATSDDLITGTAAVADYVATHYAGRPTWLVPRGVGYAMCNANLVTADGNGHLTTCLGEPVVAAGGFSGSTGTAKQYWIRAYGEIVIMRGKVQVGVTIEPGTNTVRVLAERSYVAGVDGNFVVSTKVNLGCC
jgi:hypothetical protein